ncbi:hypothetical protein EJ06DRAFT_145927 [Trichodelitschia bisporula]|uniref:Uncharacterized protein n=1 Tax=Trichodelitschia bisporula TaxID=703511 RepID=A0A6G1HN68_9PEZI|nr:hypothetical protein EJ06DRAFT_145927 [Trichodelitschia bisporula]
MWSIHPVITAQPLPPQHHHGSKTEAKVNKNRQGSKWIYVPLATYMTQLQEKRNHDNGLSHYLHQCGHSAPLSQTRDTSLQLNHYLPAVIANDKQTRRKKQGVKWGLSSKLQLRKAQRNVHDQNLGKACEVRGYAIEQKRPFRRERDPAIRGEREPSSRSPPLEQRN